jgi:hypothetical protein
MTTEPKFIALLVPKREGEFPTLYLVKHYSSCGANVDFKKADRADALLLTEEQAKRHTGIHNAFCSDSAYRGIILPA